MKANFDNTVIVIGADHHNTLAVIRCLGRKQCNQKVLIHSQKSATEKISLSQSRYAVGKTWRVNETEEDILQWLLNHTEEKQQVLFPCSDLAAYVIDANFTRLAPYYIMPGFKRRPGKVVELMDKIQQSRFAAEHNLAMARTWKLCNNDGFQIPEDMVYPCIAKPEISAFGRKSDIVICNSAVELTGALEILAKNGYQSLVIQQFLHKKYEICAYGCLVDTKRLCAGGTICKTREFPPQGGGSLTYARFVDEEAVNILRDRVLAILYESGYRGQYDIEFLVCEDGVYLNEINFRHSGNGYALVQNGVFAPYIWCADALGVEIVGKLKTTVRTGKYHMDELSDLRHVKSHRITIWKWLRDCIQTSAFSKLDIRDLPGTMAYYKPYMKNMVGKVFRRSGKQK